MKHLIHTVAAALMLCTMVACGEKDNTVENNSSNPGTTPGGNPATSTMAEGRIGNGKYIDFSGQQLDDIYGIDFDKDGIIEFRISDSYIDYVWSEGGNNVACVSADQWDIIKPLAEGETIGADCIWKGQGDAAITDYTSLPAKFYVGFRIAKGNAVNYGWARVKYDGGLTWEKCAYNTTPGGAAVAGKTN